MPVSKLFFYAPFYLKFDRSGRYNPQPSSTKSAPWRCWFFLCHQRLKQSGNCMCRAPEPSFVPARSCSLQTHKGHGRRDDTVSPLLAWLHRIRTLGSVELSEKKLQLTQKVSSASLRMPHDVQLSRYRRPVRFLTRQQYSRRSFSVRHCAHGRRQ